MRQNEDYKPRYFALQELYASNTAIHHNILNFPAAADQRRLNMLIRYVLDPLRQRFGRALRVTSGYRCTALNSIVGGSATSDHLRGLAADIVPADNTPDERHRLWAIAERMTREGSLPVKQLINEHGYTWLHISIDIDPATGDIARSPRRQIFSIPK